MFFCLFVCFGRKWNTDERSTREKEEETSFIILDNEQFCVVGPKTDGKMRDR